MAPKNLKAASGGREDGSETGGQGNGYSIANGLRGGKTDLWAKGNSRGNRMRATTGKKKDEKRVESGEANGKKKQHVL